MSGQCSAGNTETCDWHCSWHRSSYLLISLVQHTKICRTCDLMCDSSSVVMESSTTIWRHLVNLKRPCFQNLSVKFNTGIRDNALLASHCYTATALNSSLTLNWPQLYKDLFQWIYIIWVSGDQIASTLATLGTMGHWSHCCYSQSTRSVGKQRFWDHTSGLFCWKDINMLRKFCILKPLFANSST